MNRLGFSSACKRFWFALLNSIMGDLILKFDNNHNYIFNIALCFRVPSTPSALSQMDSLIAINSARLRTRMADIKLINSRTDLTSFGYRAF